MGTDKYKNKELSQRTDLTDKCCIQHPKKSIALTTLYFVLNNIILTGKDNVFKWILNSRVKLTIRVNIGTSANSIDKRFETVGQKTVNPSFSFLLNIPIF